MSSIEKTPIIRLENKSSQITIHRRSLHLKSPECHRPDVSILLGVRCTKTKQQAFFFKANHEALMGDCKVLCQTSTNGGRLSLAPLKCWR